MPSRAPESQRHLHALSSGTLELLSEMGYTVRERSTQGLAHSIWLDPRTGELVGTPDARNPDSGAAGHVPW